MIIELLRIFEDPKLMQYLIGLGLGYLHLLILRNNYELKVFKDLKEIDIGFLSFIYFLGYYYTSLLFILPTYGFTKVFEGSLLQVSIIGQLFIMSVFVWSLGIRKPIYNSIDMSKDLFYNAGIIYISISLISAMSLTLVGFLHGIQNINVLAGPNWMKLFVFNFLFVGAGLIFFELTSYLNTYLCDIDDSPKEIILTLKESILEG